MTPNCPRLMAEMLATRLCHDLTGPIGAVNNGAEFLEDDGFGMMEDAVELIAGSAKEAVNRLQFYRQAYGHQNATGEASLSDKKAVIEVFLSSTKIKLDWPDSMTDASGVFVSQLMAQLLLNLVIITQASLLRGGVIKIIVDGEIDKSLRISVIAEGDHIKDDVDIGEIILGKNDAGEINPKTVQAHLTRQLAQTLDSVIEVVPSKHSYSVIVSKQYQ